MNKKEKPQHSTKGERIKERGTVIDYYEDTYTFKTYPLNKRFFERLAPEFVNWVRSNKDVISFIEFAQFKGFPETTFRRWCKTQEAMKKAVESVYSILKIRLRKGLFSGTLREKPVLYALHTYDDEWDKMDKRWSELKNVEEKDTVVNVHMAPLASKKETDD